MRNRQNNNQSASPCHFPIKKVILCLILAYIYSLSCYAHSAESAKSAEISAISDRTPPAAPTGLTLSLDGNGVKAAWSPPVSGLLASNSQLPTPGSEPLTYNLYRSSAPITTIAGLAPVAASANTINVTDPLY